MEFGIKIKIMSPIVTFIVLFGIIGIARLSANKTGWNKVSKTLKNGKPETMVMLDVQNIDIQSAKNRLIASLPNSIYKQADNTNASEFVLEDKLPSDSMLHTMYFYPLYFSTNPQGQTHIEIGIIDKEAFLGSKQDRLEKVKRLFDYISTILK